MYSSDFYNSFFKEREIQQELLSKFGIEAKLNNIILKAPIEEYLQAIIELKEYYHAPVNKKYTFKFKLNIRK